MASLMTGSAHTMTIPQIDNVLKKLQARLKEKEVAANPTLKTKVENLIFDYTKAKNKILRYYEKTKSRHPELVTGKIKTLTLVEIARLQGKEGKANRLSQKQEKWAYNAIDFARDTKGAIINIAGTCGVLGAANILTNKFLSKGLVDLVAQGLHLAWSINPSTTLLMGTAAAIGVGFLVIPKVARLIHKIKMNKTAAREMNNEILGEAMENDIDLKNQSLQEIAQRLKDDPELLRKFNDGEFDFDGYTPEERSKLKSAMAIANENNAKERRENYTAGGKAEYRRVNHEKFVQDFEAAYNKKPRNVEEAKKVFDDAEKKEAEAIAAHKAAIEAEEAARQAELDAANKASEVSLKLADKNKELKANEGKVAKANEFLTKYPAAKEFLDKQIAEAKEEIAKLQAGSSAGGSSTGTDKIILNGKEVDLNKIDKKLGNEIRAFAGEKDRLIETLGPAGLNMIKPDGTLDSKKFPKGGLPVNIYGGLGNKSRFGLNIESGKPYVFKTFDELKAHFEHVNQQAIKYEGMANVGASNSINAAALQAAQAKLDALQEKLAKIEEQKALADGIIADQDKLQAEILEIEKERSAAMLEAKKARDAYETAKKDTVEKEKAKKAMTAGKNKALKVLKTAEKNSAEYEEAFNHLKELGFKNEKEMLEAAKNLGMEQIGRSL